MPVELPTASGIRYNRSKRGTVPEFFTRSATYQFEVNPCFLLMEAKK